MSRFFKDLKIMLLANLWIVPVLAALIGAVFYFVAPPPPMSAVMATGNPNGAYQVFAERLQAELARQGFSLTLVPTSGSQDNLQRLLEERPQVQIALIQSGLELQLTDEQRQRLQTLGAVYQEPLWLFQRKGFRLQQLTDLLGARLAYGQDGSGVQAAVNAIFAANAITPQQYPNRWQAIGEQDAAEALLTGKLDAAFFIGPAESARIQHLAVQPGLKLVNVRRAAAYQARLPFLKSVEVSEGLLDLAHNAPSAPLTTLAPMATLVINNDFNPGLVPLFLEASREVMKEGTLLDPADTYPNAEIHTFALSEDAGRYYQSGLPLLQRYLPFRIASLADRYIVLLIPLIVVLIPLLKAIGPLYRWRIRARIYRWYRELREIDRQLDEDRLPERLEADIQRLEKLEARLARIEVPLSYSNELYALHLHLRYVIERLQSLHEHQAQNRQAR